MTKAETILIQSTLETAWGMLRNPLPPSKDSLNRLYDAMSRCNAVLARGESPLRRHAA